MSRTARFEDVLAKESPELREAIRVRSAEIIAQQTARGRAVVRIL